MDPVSQSISGSLLCYIPRRESLLRAEESLDVILPDRFPDASEILSVSGRAVIKGYDRSSGSWSILLIAELRALFLSDSGETRILSAEIPVTVKSSLEGGEDGVPTCVAACGMRALDFGTYEELLERHPEASQQLACMPDASITNPTVFIDARECAFDPNYRDLVL